MSNFKNSMIEVFTTNIENEFQAEKIIEILEKNSPHIKIDFDLSETEFPYPCGHTILRVEGTAINNQHIISLVKELGFLCDILEDKLCKSE
ncbi:hypothetical protein [Tenacibaculum sp. IB213877]|uniref:hypothetical protein n=1 Tax=Tenacibaculum sp. IB213877 TaxID=3097351 RepID=UPI002A5ACD04|nr:hypothetical protein [Tenacibaculum sp. IB213877]MDY0779430.1 hypothetical protein [Tenacibaculum sp. IB213877]